MDPRHQVFVTDQAPQRDVADLFNAETPGRRRRAEPTQELAILAVPGPLARPFNLVAASHKWDFVVDVELSGALILCVSGKSLNAGTPDGDLDNARGELPAPDGPT